MSEFIVLGLIPGTRVQITFFLWVLVVIVLSVFAIAWVGHRTHIARDWLITLRLFTLTKNATYKC